MDCPLCRKSEIDQIRTGVREDSARPVYRCRTCALQFLTPPDYDLRAYYESEYRQKHSTRLGQVTTPREDYEVNKILIAKRVAYFRENVPAGATVLDVGCGSGAFLDAIRDDYSVYGTDWNPEYATFVRDELGIPCDTEDVATAFPGRTFTAITAYHVIEHVPDPRTWLRSLRDRVIGGGWIALETPNADFALAAVFDISAFRDFWYRESHLCLFNMANMAHLCELLGIEARITLRERYSFANTMHWLLKGQPQKDARIAQFAYTPVPKEHPAANLVNRWFLSIDAQYRNLLDGLKATDSLAVIGRKREI